MFAFQRATNESTRITDRIRLKNGTKNTICIKLNVLFTTLTCCPYSVNFGRPCNNEVIVFESVIAISMVLVNVRMYCYNREEYEPPLIDAPASL